LGAIIYPQFPCRAFFYLMTSGVNSQPLNRLAADPELTSK
jgi:hypothetical protein